MNRSVYLPALVAGLTAAVLALDPRASVETAASIASGSLVMLLLVYATAAVSAGLSGAGTGSPETPALTELLPVPDWQRLLRLAAGALLTGLAGGLAALVPLLLVMPRAVQTPQELPALFFGIGLCSLQGAALGTWVSARREAPARSILRTSLGVLAVFFAGWLLSGLPWLPGWARSLGLALPVPQAGAAAAGLLPLAALPAGLGLTLLFMLLAVREAVLGRRV